MNKEELKALLMDFSNELNKYNIGMIPVSERHLDYYIDLKFKNMGKNKIVEVALTQVQTKEEPPNTNNTKYGEWFGLNGVAWCGIFVSWVYANAGFPLPNIGFKKGFAGCQTAVAYFKTNNKITKTPEPGDIVFFDWNNDGRYDHTGIYMKHIDSKSFQTIEGNTAVGNDSNGGEVMSRKRTYGSCIFVNVDK